MNKLYIPLWMKVVECIEKDCSQVYIHKIVNATYSQVTKVINELCDAKILTKTPNGRTNKINLTGYGYRLKDHIHETLQIMYTLKIPILGLQDNERRSRIKNWYEP